MHSYIFKSLNSRYILINNRDTVKDWVHSETTGQKSINRMFLVCMCVCVLAD